MSHKEFDELIERITSHSSYNLKILSTISLLYMVGGVLVITVSLTIPIIREQHQIEGTLLFMVASINQIGFTVGSIITPIYLKNYSRKIVITWSFWASIMMALALTMSPSLVLIYVLRFLIGVCTGIYMTEIPCLITEASSFNKRGFNFGIAFFVWPLGGLIPTFTFKYLNTQEAINSSYIILGIVSGMISYHFLPQSPKQLIQIKKYSESLDAVKFMKSLAGLSHQLTEKQFETVQDFTKKISSKQIQQRRQGMSSLFVPDMIKRTLIVGLLFTVFFSIYNYIIFCLPQLLMTHFSNNKQQVQKVTYLCLISESIGYLAAAKILQISTFGKKRTMIYCGIGLFITSVFLSMGQDMTLCLVVCNLLLGLALTAIYPLTTQMFSIKHRLEIVAFGQIFSQFVPSIVTLVVGGISGLDLRAPFVLIAIVLVATIYCLFELPDDKTDISLDEELLLLEDCI